MSFNTTLPINANVDSNIPMNLKGRTRSLIPRSNNSVFSNNTKGTKSKNSELGVMDKLKHIFSSKQSIANNEIKENENMNRNIDINQSYLNTSIPQRNSRTKLQTSTSQFPNPNFAQYSTSIYKGGSNNNVEWQPVYHDTCKIKLPVNPPNVKISVPQEAIDEWTNDQANITKGTLGSLSKSDITKNFSQKNDTSNESQTNRMNSCISQNACTSTSNKDEPYSKFKYYYNYYLVDEYLDSLAQSQNKKIDATGLNEEGELYENSSLSIKPILKTKERLESGVPYDPKVLLN